MPALRSSGRAEPGGAGGHGAVHRHPQLRRLASDQGGVTMTEIPLAWMLTRVTSPVAGATRFHHADGAAKAVDLDLTEEETAYLEAP